MRNHRIAITQYQKVDVHKQNQAMQKLIDDKVVTYVNLDEGNYQPSADLQDGDGLTKGYIEWLILTLSDGKSHPIASVQNGRSRLAAQTAITRLRNQGYDIRTVMKRGKAHAYKLKSTNS